MAPLRRLVELRPGWAEGHLDLGVVLYNVGDLDGAIAGFSRAVELAPESARAHESLGTALWRQGRKVEAARHLQRGALLRSRLPPDAELAVPLPGAAGAGRFLIHYPARRRGGAIAHRWPRSGGLSMPFTSGKRAFLDVLKQEGVEYLFGNPGTTELPLMDGLVEEPALTYVLALQEAAVVAMADGYAQASGKLGVISVHVAPGLGNALGMLYDAQKAGAPLLVTAGQHDQTFNVTEPILWADLPPIARPFVKWSAEVRRLEDLPRLVHRAAKTALAPPTGPVFLSLPADVLQAEGVVELGAPTRVAPRIRGDRAAVEAAAETLARAERPLILAGDAVAPSDAHAELVAVAEALGAAVYAEGVANTASFPSSHPSVPRPVPPAGARGAPGAVGGRRAVLGRRRPPDALAPVRHRSHAARSRGDPPRHRSLGARKELPHRRGDPRRPEGHAARAARGARGADDPRQAPAGARAAARPSARTRPATWRSSEPGPGPRRSGCR